MTDLVEWLTKILDEDEAAAREETEMVARYFADWDVSYRWSRAVRSGGHTSSLSTMPGAPSPAQVLADIAAKRAIIALHDGSHSCTELIAGVYADDWPEFMPWGKPGEPWQHPSNEHQPDDDSPCPTLCALASAYADRPGWRDEWRV